MFSITETKKTQNAHPQFNHQNPNLKAMHIGKQLENKKIWHNLHTEHGIINSQEANQNNLKKGPVQQPFKYKHFVNQLTKKNMKDML